jgi:ZIP family zinc transporter
MNNFSSLWLPYQAFIAACIAWLSTTLGASLVFFFKKMNRKVFVLMLGVSAGIMLAASFTSLLLPSFEASKKLGHSLPALWPAIGFVVGGCFIRFFDFILPHLHPSLSNTNNPEGPKTSLRRSLLLVFAVTLHNIPEGLAMGVSFGATQSGFNAVSVAAAWALVIGIALQDMPEGFAVAVPLRGEGLSRLKAFMWGSLSGLIEPIAAFLGALLVLQAQNGLPFILAFAAGAMTFVVIEEIIPEIYSDNENHSAIWGFMIGLILMTVLDVTLG